MGTTFLQHQTEVAAKVRMNLESPTQESLIQKWLNDAQMEIEKEQGWWFASRTFSITPSVGVRSYAFPTTDYDGNAATPASIDADSMRTASRELTWSNPSEIDRDFKNWVATSDNGAPSHWTVEGYRIAFNRKISTEWAAAHPIIMFRGFMEFTALSADADESIIPNRWRRLLETYAIAMGHDRQGDQQEGQKQLRQFRMDLEEMVSKCVPVQGETKKVRAPLIWNLPTRRAGRQSSVRR